MDKNIGRGEGSKYGADFNELIRLADRPKYEEQLKVKKTTWDPKFSAYYEKYVEKKVDILSSPIHRSLSKHPAVKFHLPKILFLPVLEFWFQECKIIVRDAPCNHGLADRVQVRSWNHIQSVFVMCRWGPLFKYSVYA